MAGERHLNFRGIGYTEPVEDWRASWQNQGARPAMTLHPQALEAAAEALYRADRKPDDDKPFSKFPAGSFWGDRYRSEANLAVSAYLAALPPAEVGELVERLTDTLAGDHTRGCQGREYSCECGYDYRKDAALDEAAAALLALQAKCNALEARAEAADATIARLREALEDISKQSLVAELSSDVFVDANFEDGYDSCIRRARAVLTAEAGE